MRSSRRAGLREAWTGLVVLVDTFRVVLTVPPEPPPAEPDDDRPDPREEDR